MCADFEDMVFEIRHRTATICKLLLRFVGALVMSLFCLNLYILCFNVNIICEILIKKHSAFWIIFLMQAFVFHNIYCKYS